MLSRAKIELLLDTEERIFLYEAIEEEIQLAEVNGYNRGFKDISQKRNSFRALLEDSWYLIVGILFIAGVCLILFRANQFDTNKMNHQMDTCSRGNQAGCIEAVIYQRDNINKQDLLLEAYRNKTNEELPKTRY